MKTSHKMKKGNMFEFSVTCFVFLYSLHVYGFNLDEEVVQRDFSGFGVRQSSIYFGYTVSLLSTSNHAQELFVGSPFDKIQTINDKQLAYRERSTGNLYRCGDLNLDNGVTFVHRKNCSIVSTSQETSVAGNPLQALTMSMVGASWDEGQSNLVVCNNMWTRNCKDAYKTEGVCYVTNTTSELNVLNRPKWKQLSPCKRECYRKMIDFMFVVDGSRSVGNESFEVVKHWIQQVTSGFDISSSVQVGVVQYSTYQYRKVVQPFIKTEIRLGEYKDHILFDAAVDKIKYHDRSTFTAYAIRKTVNEDFKGNMSRYPDSRRVMVLLTDGQSTDKEDLSSAAAEAKQEGVETFAVGVGSKIILSELVLIAGSPDKVITVNDFNELLGIVNQLQGDIQLLDGTSNNETNNDLTQCQAGTSSTLSKNEVSSFPLLFKLSLRRLVNDGFKPENQIHIFHRDNLHCCFVARLAAGAPTEEVKTYKDTDKEDGTAIIEPIPSLRAALTSTSAMGALYYCENMQKNFKNISGTRYHNCSMRAGVQRDLSGFEISDRDALGISLTHEPFYSPDGYSLETKNTLVTCAHLRIHDCGAAYKAEGACYVSESTPGRGDSNMITKWHKRVPCRDSCFERDIDLMFVVDGSYSVGNESFDKVKVWIKEVTNGFEIKQQVQVGVVQYSYFYPNREDQPYMKTEISLGQFKNKTLFDQAVDAIYYQQYTTYTAHAINKTVKEDFNSGTSRYPSARRVMILLTDGNADDATQLPGATAYAEAQGVESFAVGVGQYKLKQLELIAGSKDRIITVDNFDDLSSVVSQLQRGIQIMEGSTAPGVTNELMQCQAGFSTSFDKSGRLILGAPGAYDWAGTITKYDSASDTTADIPTFTQVQGVLPNRTKESYLGYSVSTGLYDGSGKQFVASGAPRYMLEGGVVLYEPQVGSSNFTNSQTIQAYGSYKQLGSYFGATLLSADINGDGKDDLLVGAPLYIGDNYDEGRVFVYLSQASNSIQAWASPGFVPKVFSGMKDVGGRFGSAISSAGDLNNDGFKDVIIGAPLADNGAGVVYVYHGSSDFGTANSLQYKQRIAATALSGTNLQYFGQSLQGGVDLDGNRYPDVAVGAPRSDTVVIFRTRPVAKFNTTLTFNKLNVPIFECFRREFRDCLQLRACIGLSGKGLEKSIKTLFSVVLDSSVTKKRVEFRNQANQTANGYTSRDIVLNITTPAAPVCFNYPVYVKTSIEDYSEPIVATMTYSLSSSHLAVPLSSISDPFIPKVKTASTSFETDCGVDQTCSYDLSIAGTQYIIPRPTPDLSNGGTTLVISRGSDTQRIVAKLNLTNTGEPAFDPQVTLSFTSALGWGGTQNVQSSNPDYVQCIQSQDPTTVGSTKSVVLSYKYNAFLGSIMQRGQWCYFELKLSYNQLTNIGNIPRVLVNILADTKKFGLSNDTNPSDNSFQSTTPVIYVAAADVTSQVNLQNIPFNFTDTNVTITSVEEIADRDIPIDFEIKGKGHAVVPESTITLHYPNKIGDLMHLFYLYKVDCLTTGGNARCVCDTSIVNPYQLSLDPPNVNITTPNVTILPNPDNLSAGTYDCSGPSLPGYCQSLKCNISNLAQDDVVKFSAKFKLWSKTLRQQNKTQIDFVTTFLFSANKSAYLVDAQGNPLTDIIQTITTPANHWKAPEFVTTTDYLWVYILAAIGGLLLLLLIIGIMYKTGFFKSKYAEMKQEALEWNEANPNGNVEEHMAAD
uniref:integrin alpha-L isoform X3 n=1 Tax=Ciona intestinalis TaxID=7719 RepID=UPI000EF46E12|nr:integrin alpha-L isoform X3 [Ciona intestinalis]|eukprot:XP_026694499.1 integrin alpha-L isoform X3 [Ciona intestinalis]